MGIIVVLSCFFVVFGVLRLILGYYDGDWAGVLSILMLVMLLIAVGLIPVARMSINGDIAAIEEARRTVAAARENENVTDLEIAAIQQTVVKMNSRLAVLKYYRKTFYAGIYVPRCVLDTEPIR